MLGSEIWIVVSVSCQNCGKDVAVSHWVSEPTKEQIRANEVRIGGGTCVDSYVSQIVVDGKPIQLEVIED